MYTEEEGRSAVRFARAVIERHLGIAGIEPPDLSRGFDEECGAFVTLVTHPDRDLRGCIGYIEAVKSLRETLEDVAISAATRDPRFPPVRAGEMDRLVVEVSLLTPLDRIPAHGEEIIHHVEIGRHGLVVERGPYRGVLLPQVPVKYEWDVPTFLAHTCAKAGLPPDAWLDPLTTFHRFGAEVFEEVAPRGEVRRKDLRSC
ncbi:MAG TPA: TIGR00296 family protein [Thermoplasmata archaeon]|nr:TIGR00296 family protein [Thermoplasmata archaeon]